MKGLTMQRTMLSISIAVLLNCAALTVVSAQNDANRISVPTRNSGVDLQWVDSSVRPQDNFFRFVSGKWLATEEIPADRARYGSFDALRELSERRCHELIDALSSGTGPAAQSGDRKLADLYASFMNEKLADRLDDKPLRAIFARVDHITSKAQLPALSAEFNRLRISVPVNTGISQDARDATKYAVYVNQGGLTMPDRDYYLKQDDAKLKGFRDAYQKHVQTMLAMTGSASAEKSAADIVALETELARAQWTRVQNRDPVKTYNKVEIGSLHELLPNFDWKKYFATSGIGSRVDYVIVRQPGYITDIGKVINDTPLEVWKTYFKWRALNAFAPFLSARFVDEDFAFSQKTLTGVPENRPRWKRGIAEIEAGMPEQMGRLYVAKYFPAADKARMEQLVQNLILAYRQSIESLTWMGPETKQQALTKLAKFTPKIGYPAVWRDYSKLVVKKDDLLGNVIRAREFEDRRQINKLGQPVDKAEWGMSPQTVNAYYNSRNNEIVFPAAILQPPFYTAGADDAVNYGGIGAVIGHEISHGFDDSGSQSDGDGNLRDWWTAEDKANFKKLTAALVEQYNAFSPLPGYHVNGALTLGENIADNSGLAIAYKAYLLSLGGNPAPLLDGYSGVQRFYLGWSQVWRGKSRDAETIRLLAVDPHSPSEARGNLPLQNQPGFYSAFDVKENDQMYLAPDKRIIIW